MISISIREIDHTWKPVKNQVSRFYIVLRPLVLPEVEKTEIIAVNFDTELETIDQETARVDRLCC